MKQRQFGHFIGGLYAQSEIQKAVNNPLQSPELERSFARIESPTGPDGEILEAALEGAHLSFEQVQDGFFPLPERLAFLERLKRRTFEQKENLARLLSLEIAKPLDLARREIDRVGFTLQETIEAAPRLLSPEGLPLNARPGFEGHWGYFERVPRGPLLALTPFNFPLNLAAHKIAPALASGNPVLLKPSEKAAVSTLAWVDLMKAEGLPAGLLSCLQTSPPVTEALLKDHRVRQFSFTGSAQVGWHLAGLRPLPSTLELGGSGLVFVDRTADLARVVSELIQSAFGFAGQVCIATQSILVHQEILAEFVEVLTEAFHRMPVGDPQKEGVLMGPVIDEAAAKRLRAEPNALLDQGLKFERISHAASSPFPSFVSPELWITRDQTLLKLPLFSQELFGPFVFVAPVAGLEDFCRIARAQKLRLQVGLYSKETGSLLKAAQKLDFGGVVLNGPPSLRFDAQPYGGRGESGRGREGPRFAIESFTETRSVLVKSF